MGKVMAMRHATEDELARWDELVAANPDGGNSLQTKTWGEFKARWGWWPERFVYELPGGRLVVAQWLKRTIPAVGTIWYCPKGPGIVTPVDYLEVVKQTRKAGLLSGIFARFEPEVLADDVKPAALTKAGLVRANRDPASKATIFVDLSAGEEAMLASFSQSARRNIRKAQAGGVVVEAVEPTADNLQAMFELMKATEARAKYGLRPQDYFTDYWKAQTEVGQAQLFLARHDGDVLAGLFLTYLGQRGWYKDGGSFDIKRELQAPYLVQWEVMRWCLERGIVQYDLLGSPNRDKVGTGDPKDGLYTFKSKFNPDITEFAGCYDLPLAGGLAYKAWRKIGERVAARLAVRSRERFLY